MPTIKQKKIVKKISENIRISGNTKTLQEIALESGFSPSMAKTPSRILQGKGVIELFEKSGITPSLLAGKYKELLDMPLKEDSVSADTRRKTLDDIGKRILDRKETELDKKMAVIKKFISIKVDNNPEEIIKEAEIIQEE